LLIALTFVGKGSSNLGINYGSYHLGVTNIKGIDSELPNNVYTDRANYFWFN